MKNNTYDFSGWATKANVRCADGRVIMPNAFAHDSGRTVPLVWNHDHTGADKVAGNVLLENRPEGVYAYGSFNDTEIGNIAKALVRHGDITSMSIWANKLDETPKLDRTEVYHGRIREVSLVLAGANEGATIDNIIMHSDDDESMAYIYVHEDEEELDLEGGVIDMKQSEDEKDVETVIEHNQTDENDIDESNVEAGEDIIEHADDKTVKDVLDTLTDEQLAAVMFIIGASLEDAEEKKETENDKKEPEDEGGDKSMKHNLFENAGTDNEKVLSHAEIEAVFNDCQKYGSLKQSCLEHGITNIEYLFPEAKTVGQVPTFIKRDTGWVARVMNGTHHSPFSRIKSIFANITEDDARAKGYLKGHQKKEEVFPLLKRVTTPTTVYKKQKLDRDDIVDITDLDVVQMIKGEMRGMLEEEIARAILIGDGRSAISEDKINESNIRPIWKDEDLYTIKSTIAIAENATSDDVARAFIRSCIKSRKLYKGAGEPVMFATEDIITDCLLLEDKNGRVIYETEAKLATALRVKEIVTVPVMEGQTRMVSEDKHTLQAIIVNLHDYNIGADKGGNVNMFDDFDIDYNQYKYLIETRCSGALVTPYSAIAIETTPAK